MENLIGVLNNSNICGSPGRPAISAGKRGFPHTCVIVFLFLDENTCRRGTSAEYPQHLFSPRNVKTINTFPVKKNVLSGDTIRHIWVNCLQSSHSIQTPKFLYVAVHAIIIGQYNLPRPLNPNFPPTPSHLPLLPFHSHRPLFCPFTFS